MADQRKAPRSGPRKPGAARPQGGPAETTARDRSARPRPAGPPGGLLIYGGHAVAAALTNPRRRCRRLWCSEEGDAVAVEALGRAKALGIARPAPERADRRELDRLTDRAVHQGIVLSAEPLAPPRLEDLVGRLSDGPAILVVLDRVTDPHNVGAILRSAAVFGARGVIVTDRHAPPETGSMARAASGALELVPLLRVINLARTLAWLKAQGFACLGLDEAGEPAAAMAGWGSRLALVLGAEGEGLRRLSREGCDALVRLPAPGPMSTLNVSCAAAVALYAAASALDRPAGGG
jgi:23S rRNA (guanosine2251-2'-O)-methyltransferase